MVASIEEEDRQEAAARRAQQVATREYVESFVQEQQLLKQRRQQQLDAEDARQAHLPAQGIHGCHPSAQLPSIMSLLGIYNCKQLLPG